MIIVRQLYVLLAYTILSITVSVSYAADTQSLDEYLSQFVKGKKSADAVGFSDQIRLSKEGSY